MRPQYLTATRSHYHEKTENILYDVKNLSAAVRHCVNSILIVDCRRLLTARDDLDLLCVYLRVSQQAIIIREFHVDIIMQFVPAGFTYETDVKSDRSIPADQQVLLHAQRSVRSICRASSGCR